MYTEQTKYVLKSSFIGIKASDPHVAAKSPWVQFFL